MEGAGPREAGYGMRDAWVSGQFRIPLLASRIPKNPLSSTHHDFSSAPCECEQQDAVRVHAFGDEVRDAVGEGVGFAGAGAGDDEERRRRRGSGRELRSVQHEAPNISRSLLRANEVDQTDALYRI